MLVKCKTMSSCFVLLLLQPCIVSSEPIGSLKSLKTIKYISIQEAPTPNTINNTTSNTTSNSPSNSPSNSQATVKNEKVDEIITRSQFTTAIVDREPTDDVIMLTSNMDKVYFFTELANLKGHEITHRWEYQGKLMAEIKFNVKSDRWRIFSSKKIKPDWTGKWSVVLVDDKGNSLDVSKLEVVDALAN